MTLYVNGVTVPCPRCYQPLPGWRREVLVDDQDRDRVIRTIECPCGWFDELERFLIERRPPHTHPQAPPVGSFGGPGSARRSDPVTARTAAGGDFTGRRLQALLALADGPLDAHQLARVMGVDANQAARRARDLVDRGAAVVHDEHVGERGRPVTRWALTPAGHHHATTHTSRAA